MIATTYLFVPGDRPDRFAKAAASGADVVVLDLEDAVAPDSKSAARASLADALSRSGLSVCVRVNAADTPWFKEDCRLLSLPGVAAVMLPKAETVDELRATAMVLGAGVPLIPIIETARGLAEVTVLAGAPSVQRLAFGSVDFQRDLGIEGDDLELLFARSQLVLASRLAGVAAPVDGVTLAVNDPELTRADARRSRRLGFGAKLCIHPAQIDPVREAFRPDATEMEWAKGVLEAASSTSAGALKYEGQMIDKPVIERARSVLRRAGVS